MISFPPPGEYHGTEIFEEGVRQGWTRNEKAKGRDAEERSFGTQGEEPKAGDRNRSVRGPARGKESPSEERLKEKEERQEIGTQVETVEQAARTPANYRPVLGELK